MGQTVSHCQLEVISLAIYGGVRVKLLQDCNYFVATTMTVQGIPLSFVMSNTGIYDIESQDLIPYYLAPFVIISSRSKETVQCCKAISPTNLPVLFTLVLHITVKLECDGDTFPPFYAFQLCSTKLLVHRRIWRSYHAGGKMRFQDPTLRNGRLLKPRQSKSQDDSHMCSKCFSYRPIRQHYTCFNWSWKKQLSSKVFRIKTFSSGTYLECSPEQRCEPSSLGKT